MICRLVQMNFHLGMKHVLACRFNQFYAASQTFTVGCQS